MNDESRAYVKFILQNWAPPKDFNLQLMRERSEHVHAKVNEKLIGKFTGKEEERKIEIDENTGRIRSFNDNVLKLSYSEIPITIYTPVDVNKDKIVVFFHGGGKNILCFRTILFIKDQC